MKNFYEFRLFSFRNFTLSLSLRRFPAPRSPYKTGAADRYYGRKQQPHYTNRLGVDVYSLNEKQREEYVQGWSEEEDRKDWG